MRSALDYELLRTSIGGEDGQIPGTGIVAPPNKGFDPSLPKLSQGSGGSQGHSGRGATWIRTATVSGNCPMASENERPQHHLNTTRPANPYYLRIAEILKANLEVGIRTTLTRRACATPTMPPKCAKGRPTSCTSATLPGVAAMYDTRFYVHHPKRQQPLGT